MEKSTVFRMMDPEALSARYNKAWEYFLPGDEVDIDFAGGGGVMAGVVQDVMPDGTGLWIYVNGVGRRLFGAEEGVEIRVVRKVPRPDITANTNSKDEWRLF
ncbi:hypothetical protein ACIPY2_17430 [Paenarthrobacter sp. NPDC089675]|uniref:hypothetical protein n=1 Tax=Paenarthrobacter sp. NPDC089675 TaxID=3364376 RepID=UPI003801469E